MPFLQLPSVPVPHADLPAYLEKHADQPVAELFEPYRKYESTLREVFAQEPSHLALTDPHIGVLPLFTEDTPKLRVRARNLAAESDEVKSRYIMPLPDTNRRPDGAPATVASIGDFQSNFAVFSEMALAGLNWDNVVAAGSSVTSCLLPVPTEYAKSRRSLREYYHEKLCPASDVDLFLYGLTEEQAMEKIKQIEAAVRDSTMSETTTVRTKNAVTICSEYPTRHVQIVLRIYKSISEIVAGFDIDCSSAVYDGRQVYCTPRALQSFVTQVNHIDLTRRSPSYENRLSKYSHRNFEVYWPILERSRIDPTIFERSFTRVQGLARLLVLERLPTPTSRAVYASARREERGRPEVTTQYGVTGIRGLHGNIKDEHEDEVAEWFTQDELNNYDTFVLPYGKHFHAKKIERLCYSRDLLLNAEWNQKKDREVYLHRHPAFFGRVEDVMEDCCGFCPVPQTEQEKEIAEAESKVYVSGKISFLADNPGRQQIGSFNPLTDDDWTEMAYVGNTARLCQAIVDGDQEHVEDWLAQEGVDPNQRDYTGRTPLHLAVLVSTPEIVKLLVDNGARLILRLADGRTALHLAAQRGDPKIVKILMDKSIENEEEEAEKEDLRRKAKLKAEEGNSKKRNKVNTDGDEGEVEGDDEDDDTDESDGELVDDDSSDDGVQSTTTASFVKVRSKNQPGTATDLDLSDAEEVPDFYDVNVTAWDQPCSALHFAIMAGRREVVELLCQEYGADVLRPVKFTSHHNSSAIRAVLSLTLALSLPPEVAPEMVGTLLKLGATCSQADANGITAFHKFVESDNVELVRVLLDYDQMGSAAIINHIAFASDDDSYSPLLAAITNGNVEMARLLLDHGAAPTIDFETWLKSAKASELMRPQLGSFEDNKANFKKWTVQPLVAALASPNPSIAIDLLDHGADPDTKKREAYGYRKYTWARRNESPEKRHHPLQVVRQTLATLREYVGEKPIETKPSKEIKDADAFLAAFPENSWIRFAAQKDLEEKERMYNLLLKGYEEALERIKLLTGEDEKKTAISEMISTLERVEARILSKAREKEFAEAEEQPTDKAAKEPPKPYEFLPRFTMVTDITDARHKAYIKLFEAVWRGDLDTIKGLTLAAWSEEEDSSDGGDIPRKNQPPLAITVRDDLANSPFSLAFMRGNTRLASAICEIARAQYAPEKPNVRYAIMGNDSDEDSQYSCGDSETSFDGNYRMIVDNDQFTIDNMGEVSTQVKSKVTPLDMLHWACATFTMKDGEIENFNKNPRSIFQFVIEQNDLRGLNFLLNMATRYSNLDQDSSAAVASDSGARFYALRTEDCEFAFAQGHIDVLAVLIKRTGLGIPLERMVQDSGVDLQQRPRYYQGLTVYGKKRGDWAEAGRRKTQRESGLDDSPLLYAALHGCLETVEWFMGDAPKRCYLEFTASKAAQGDARVAHLGRSRGGFEGAISRWLAANRKLALCDAITQSHREEGMAIIKYLIKAVPEAISATNHEWDTPLMMAVKAGHIPLVRLLLENGADPTERNTHSGANLLHLALEKRPKKVEQLKALLDLFDPDVLQDMFCERARQGSYAEGATPLHSWLKEYVPRVNYSYYYARLDDDDVASIVAVVRLLLARSGGRELHLLNSEGETVLHMLARWEGHPAIVRAILDNISPDQAALLLRRENAVGATPFEVARDRLPQATVSRSRDYGARIDYPGVDRWPTMDTASFVPPTALYVGAKAPLPQRVYDRTPTELRHAKIAFAVFSESLARYAGTGADGKAVKRQLVSLNEANLVAARINYQGERYSVKVDQPAAPAPPATEETTDTVPRYRDHAAFITRQFEAKSWMWEEYPPMAGF